MLSIIYKKSILQRPLSTMQWFATAQWRAVEAMCDMWILRWRMLQNAGLHV